MQTRWERIAHRVETETTRPRLTKGAIAKELEISRPALNRRLRGEVEWHYDDLLVLADLLDITLDDLVSGEPGENGTHITADP